jgi:hypothetical protein
MSPHDITGLERVNNSEYFYLKIIYVNNHQEGKFSKLTLGAQIFLKMKIVIEKSINIKKKRQQAYKFRKICYKKSEIWAAACEEKIFQNSGFLLGNPIRISSSLN